MVYPYWDKSMEMGDLLLDNQHFEIAEHIGLLRSAILKEKHNETIRLLGKVHQLMEQSFAYEEKIMTSIDYPLYDSHKKVHDNFLRKLKDYKKAAQDGEEPSRKVISELSVWLTDHVRREDRDCANFIAANSSKGILKKIFGKIF